MQWNKKQKELIEKVIQHYETELKKDLGDRMVWRTSICPFCKTYYDNGCFNCPNEVIVRLMGIKTKIPPCRWTIKHLPDFKECYYHFLLHTDYCISLRIEFWEDALVLDEKDFFKKWYGR